MSELIYKNYFFSCQEMMVLSALLSMETLRMPCEKKHELTPERRNQVIFGLYQRKVLYLQDDGKCRLSTDAEQIFRNIKESEREIVFVLENGVSLLQCFVGKQAIVAESSSTEKETVRLHNLSWTDFIRELYDSEFWNTGGYVSVYDRNTGTEQILMRIKHRVICGDTKFEVSDDRKTECYMKEQIIELLQSQIFGKEE